MKYLTIWIFFNLLFQISSAQFINIKPFKPVDVITPYQNLQKQEMDNQKWLIDVVNELSRQEVEKFNSTWNEAISYLKKERISEYDCKTFIYIYNELKSLANKSSYNANKFNNELKKLDYSVGYCYNEIGDIDRAKMFLNNSVANGFFESQKLLDEINFKERLHKFFIDAQTDYKDGKMDEAIININEAIKMVPEESYLYYFKGLCYSKKGLKEEGIIFYKKSISLDSSFSMAYNNIAWNLYLDKRYKEALPYANKSLLKDAENYLAYDTRASIKFYLNDIAGCLKDCDLSINLNTNDISENNNTFFIRGRAKYRNKDFQGACNDWKKAIEVGNKEAQQFVSNYCK